MGTIERQLRNGETDMKPTTYEQEVLSALYKSLDFMMCNDLPTHDVEFAINEIEKKYRVAA